MTRRHYPKTRGSGFTLWLGSMARTDILVALSFLGKRTTKADEDDEKKVRKVIAILEQD